MRNILVEIKSVGGGTELTANLTARFFLVQYSGQGLQHC